MSAGGVQRAGALPSRPQQLGAVSALAFLLVVTAAWWALALWPVPGATPAWLDRARWVCFNAGPDGLPDASGWLLLIGQPIGMAAVLVAVWGDALRHGVAAILSVRRGRVLVACCAASLALGVGATALRLLEGMTAPVFALPADALPPDTYPRLDRPAPALDLVDHTGGAFDLGALRGRPVLVTFAFGNCHSVCPAIVKQTLDVQRRAREQAASGGAARAAVPYVVVVSLDPWRDTPGRLAHLTGHWGLGQDATVLSGSVPQVETALDAWNVARQRDERTGDVVHPPLVYILDADGRIAYASTGGTKSMLELLSRIEGRPATGG